MACGPRAVPARGARRGGHRADRDRLGGEAAGRRPALGRPCGRPRPAAAAAGLQLRGGVQYRCRGFPTALCWASTALVTAVMAGYAWVLAPAASWLGVAGFAGILAGAITNLLSRVVDEAVADHLHRLVRHLQPAGQHDHRGGAGARRGVAPQRGTGRSRPPAAGGLHGGRRATVHCHGRGGAEGARLRRPSPSTPTTCGGRSLRITCTAPSALTGCAAAGTEPLAVGTGIALGPAWRRDCRRRARRHRRGGARTGGPATR